MASGLPREPQHKQQQIFFNCLNCHQQPATIVCMSCSTILCATCDVFIHYQHGATHQRKPLPTAAMSPEPATVSMATLAPGSSSMGTGTPRSMPTQAPQAQPPPSRTLGKKGSGSYAAFPPRGECSKKQLVRLARDPDNSPLFPGISHETMQFQLFFSFDNHTPVSLPFHWESERAVQALLPSYLTWANPIHAPHTTKCVIEMSELDEPGSENALRWVYWYDHDDTENKMAILEKLGDTLQNMMNIEDEGMLNLKKRPRTAATSSSIFASALPGGSGGEGQMRDAETPKGGKCAMTEEEEATDVITLKTAALLHAYAKRHPDEIASVKQCVDLEELSYTSEMAGLLLVSLFFEEYHIYSKERGETATLLLAEAIQDDEHASTAAADDAVVDELAATLAGSFLEKKDEHHKKGCSCCAHYHSAKADEAVEEAAAEATEASGQQHQAAASPNPAPCLGDASSESGTHDEIALEKAEAKQSFMRKHAVAAEEQGGFLGGGKVPSFLMRSAGRYSKSGEKKTSGDDADCGSKKSGSAHSKKESQAEPQEKSGTSHAKLVSTILGRRGGTQQGAGIPLRSPHTLFNF